VENKVAAFFMAHRVDCCLSVTSFNAHHGEQRNRRLLTSAFSNSENLKPVRLQENDEQIYMHITRVPRLLLRKNSRTFQDPQNTFSRIL